MNHLELVKLSGLMEESSGSSAISIGLIDGPVDKSNPGLTNSNIIMVNRGSLVKCSQSNSTACLHGTYIASILCAKRCFNAQAICPDCTLLVLPIFEETSLSEMKEPTTTPGELASAIVDIIDAGARVINLSIALSRPSTRDYSDLKDALDYAAKRGVITVAAAGNQGIIGSSVITRHSSVIPVVAYNLQAIPMNHSNLGNSIGRRGLGAPGEDVTGLGPKGKSIIFSGTSAATPFVTGAIALLWSQFPSAPADRVKFAITQSYSSRRTKIVPPLMNAWSAYQTLQAIYGKG